MKTKIVSNLLVVISTILFAVNLSSAQDTEIFVGTFRIDIPGKTSVSDSSRRTGNRTIEKTTTITTGIGASGAGTLEIRADGTYRITGYSGLGGTREGKWIINDEGPFSDKGGIELLEVKNENYAEDQRSWFVYLDDEGNVVGREPPYTGYNHLYFKKTKGAVSKTSVKTNPASKQTVTDKTTPTKSVKPVRKTDLSQDEIYKLKDDITAFFTGKTQREVESFLGKGEKNDTDGYSQEFSLSGAELPIDNFPWNFKKIIVQFDAPPARGGKVKSLTIW